MRCRSVCTDAIGTLLDSTALEQESGDARTWHHLNVAAFIFHAVSVNRTMARWLVMESEDFNINLSIRLWADEIQVTNPLRPESLKYLAFQFTLCQIPEHVRRKRAGIQQPRREREAPWPAGLCFEQGREEDGRNARGPAGACKAAAKPAMKKAKSPAMKKAKAKKSPAMKKAKRA